MKKPKGQFKHAFFNRYVLFCLMFFCSFFSAFSESYSHLKEFNTYEFAIQDVDLLPAIESILKQEDKDFPALKKIEQKLKKGAKTLKVQEIVDALSELDSYRRVPRPTAPSFQTNDAVVGKSDCDLSQVITFLGMLKKILIKIEQEICEKFQFTWSILNKLDIDIIGIYTALDAIECPTIDLSGIFTAREFDFYDTQTIICEK
ncbi:MAG: hypothetical protein AB7R69_05695, partial [Candidatus Babeliales bacterium]